jgi:chromosome segregation ATPase
VERSSVTERSAGDASRAVHARLEALAEKQGGIVKDVSSFEREVARLETALMEARAQLSTKRAELLLVQEEVTTIQSTTQTREAEYKAAKELNQANDMTFKNLTATKTKAQNSIRLMTTQLSTLNSTLSRDRDFKGHLLKKLTVVSAKRSSALEEIQLLQEEHNAREAAKMEQLLRELSPSSLNLTMTTTEILPTSPPLEVTETEVKIQTDSDTGTEASKLKDTVETQMTTKKRRR